jgi:hypothetical protein
LSNRLPHNAREQEEVTVRALITSTVLSAMLAAVGATAQDGNTPKYLQPMYGDPEKDSFGYIGAQVAPAAPLRRSYTTQAVQVGLRTNVDEKHTFGFVERQDSTTVTHAP